MGTCQKTMFNIGHTNFNFIIDTGSQVSIMPEIARKELALKLSDRRNSIRLRAANGIDVPYVGMVRMDIVVFGNKLGNLYMLTMNDVDLWLIVMNVLDKCVSINLNQHDIDDCNEIVNISSVYIVETNVRSMPAVNIMNMGKIDEKYMDYQVNDYAGRYIYGERR